MSDGFDIVVCGSLVPDPLQRLEPFESQSGWGLKNEAMLPAVLDPWAAHALYEASNLAKKFSGSRVFLLSLGPKAKLQQLMMNVAQKVPFELVVVDSSASGFTDSFECANALADAIIEIAGVRRERLFVFGGMSSASRDSGSTLQILGERLGILDQFIGVDEISVEQNGALAVKERVEGGVYQVSQCEGPPAVFGWATGNLPEPPNNPQVGMMNMRNVMPAIAKAKTVLLAAEGLEFKSVELPKQQRETKVVKDMPCEEIAKEIVDWIKQG